MAPREAPRGPREAPREAPWESPRKSALYWPFLVSPRVPQSLPKWYQNPLKESTNFESEFWEILVPKGIPKGSPKWDQNPMKNGPDLRRPSGSVFGPPEGQNGGLVYTRAPFSRFAQSRFLSILVYFWYQKGTLKSIKNLIKNRAHSETSFF